VSLPPANQATAENRIRLAGQAWEQSKTPDMKNRLVGAIIGWEELTGKLYSWPPDRNAFGLSDRPGQLL
jgi:hypothetical protein